MVGRTGWLCPIGGDPFAAAQAAWDRRDYPVFLQHMGRVADQVGKQPALRSQAGFVVRDRTFTPEGIAHDFHWLNEEDPQSNRF